jgi:hypothetical protein
MFFNGMMVSRKASRRNRCRTCNAALRNGKLSREIISGFSLSHLVKLEEQSNKVIFLIQDLQKIILNKIKKV